MTPSSKRAGRPLDPQVDQAIVNAALELALEHGFASLTIDAIVTRAGTTRPAFYRRFRNLSDVLLTMGQSPEPPHVPDTGSLESDLTAFIGTQVTRFADPLTRDALAEIIGTLSREPEFAREFTRRINEPARHAFYQIVHNAIHRGDLPEDPQRDLDWLYDLATGPALLRAVFPHSQPLDDTLTAHSVHAVLAALTTRLEIDARHPQAFTQA